MTRQVNRYDFLISSHYRPSTQKPIPSTKYPIPTDSLSALSLYLHIPFCQRKCPYCDFNTYAGRERRYADFAAALADDISGQGLALRPARRADAFLGGGTPTVLEAAQLEPDLRSRARGVSLADGCGDHQRGQSGHGRSKAGSRRCGGWASIVSAWACSRSMRRN